MRNKIFWLIGFVITVFASSCSKDSGCKPVPVDNEKAQLEAFNTSIGMNATRHSSGLYYEILAAGSVNKPIQASTVYVKYKGTFLDGKVFDEQSNPGMTGFLLNNLIDGWKYAIPMVGKAGKVRISVPSALAYSCQGATQGAVPIPPNTPLYFEIELVDFL
ncbi:MAG: FKBP-type peptidyl-prolyl cis-trans isomerase [Chitinophagaceae bacterium]|jgi:FKBP-type peptidyl-prolyl cis-trans isomerase FkpA|nr:FKBP-type peptidyl-prolyl cis-trans isomerase [Chitinophagaceae bacterium]